MANLTFNGTRIQYGGETLNFPEPVAGFDDWFLPSLDELDAMYTNLHVEAVGDFSELGNYWSSSESSSIFAWKESFSNGSQTNNTTKAGSTQRVRAARSFTAGVAAYALRDTGPAGGLIFYVDGGTTYYEAAPTDQTVGNDAYWCDNDLGATVLGASGTAIGTGQSNTTTMVDYPGYGDGPTILAATLCNDLVITP